jgi:uncharacterized protein
VIPPARVPGDKTLPTPDPATVQIVRSYGPGRFLIGQREWHEPVLVRPQGTVAWRVTQVAELSLASLAALREGAPTPEILVLGCGARALPVAPTVRAALKDAGLALEVVDTGSACRIYNVLVAEGRRVAAALIPL